MSVGTINNPDGFLRAARRRATQRFNKCFPPGRGISFGDLDGIVEINGNFLVTEWKTGDQDVPTGQWRSLLRMAKLPEFTVYIVWTADDAPGTADDAPGLIVRVQRVCPDTFPPPKDASEEDVVREFTEWARAADAGTLPSRTRVDAVPFNW